MIIFPHSPPPKGGVGSFQLRFQNFLSRNNINYLTVSSLTSFAPFCYVFGGTRKLFWLFLYKLRGGYVIHRLDGLNWQHTIAYPGFLKYLKAYIRLLLVRLIRRYFADHLIYQSKFIQDWWHIKYPISKPSTVIYNSIHIDNILLPLNNIKTIDIICIEGEINAIPAINILNSLIAYNVHLFGDIDKDLKPYLSNKVIFHGYVNHELLYQSLISAKIYLCLETNPPCPNSVIEALAHGIPILGFDSGSLKELVGDAGIILPYGTNPWLLETPNLLNLNNEIKYLLENYDYFSKQARMRASRLFNDDINCQVYIDIAEAFKK